MKYAKNGAALIDGNIVPKTEMTVLKALVALHRDAAVAEIAKELGETISDASLYTLLKRLQQRGLVTRLDAVLEVFGRPVQRVLWHAHQAATDFFSEERISQNDTSDSQRRAAMAM